MPLQRRRSRVVLLSTFLALLALVAVPLTAATAKNRGRGHGHHLPTIAEVRAMPLGTVVTLEGTVPTPSGVFASSFFDEGFAVQDATAGSSSASRTPTSACSRRATSR